MLSLRAAQCSQAPRLTLADGAARLHRRLLVRAVVRRLPSPRRARLRGLLATSARAPPAGGSTRREAASEQRRQHAASLEPVHGFVRAPACPAVCPPRQRLLGYRARPPLVLALPVAIRHATWRAASRAWGSPLGRPGLPLFSIACRDFSEIRAPAEWQSAHEFVRTVEGRS